MARTARFPTRLELTGDVATDLKATYELFDRTYPRPTGNLTSGGQGIGSVAMAPAMGNQGFHLDQQFDARSAGVGQFDDFPTDRDNRSAIVAR